MPGKVNPVSSLGLGMNPSRGFEVFAFSIFRSIPDIKPY
jgi:hypothetical protein